MLSKTPSAVIPSRLAGAGLAAALIAAAIRAARPFEHGIWLVAYLFLVACLAQLLLGRGQAVALEAAGMPAPPAAVVWVQAALWNGGVVAVPLGVLVDARLFVVIGAAALLAALASFTRTVAPALAARGGAPARLRRGYIALVVFMTATTLLGIALGWDRDWL